MIYLGCFYRSTLGYLWTLEEGRNNPVKYVDILTHVLPDVCRNPSYYAVLTVESMFAICEEENEVACLIDNESKEILPA